MLEEMRALVALAETGSFVRASDKLCLTPSAATRMVQRLESRLGAVLLDRTVKPPRFTAVGRTVLQQCREVLAQVEEMSAGVSPDAEPRGVLRVGLAHALADAGVVDPVQRLYARFPKVKLRLSSDLTQTLFERVRSGDLDAAVVLMPQGQLPPAPLTTRVIARDTMVIAASKAARLGRLPSLAALAGQSWVLNPTGCLLRAALVDAMQAQGAAMDIAAEVHNLHLQASLVASGYGLGLLPLRHLRSEPRRAQLRALRPGGFELPMAVSFVQGGSLGRLEGAAQHLEQVLRAVHAGKQD
ncbi:MAG: LysR family transcriptional regulator [Pseudomonadota bacterium]